MTKEPEGRVAAHVIFERRGFLYGSLREMIEARGGPCYAIDFREGGKTFINGVEVASHPEPYQAINIFDPAALDEILGRVICADDSTQFFIGCAADVISQFSGAEEERDRSNTVPNTRGSRKGK